MTQRRLNPIDKLIVSADRALRTLSGSSNPRRPRQPPEGETPALSDDERRHAAGLIRVNHSGEVCAQALYQGQALTAKLPRVRAEMERAADEEVDHLAWCEERLRELHSHTSRLNPLWYGLSFGLGAGAGLVSDRISLGFVAATEELVCRHLEGHLDALPEADASSRDLVSRMIDDERRHAETALKSGGRPFPGPVKRLMSLASRVMTRSSYRL